jgi:1-deoxy-D-xylulose-5-phosphate reductoisomerase
MDLFKEIRKVAVLGSTGSVGSNTLAVLRQNLNAFQVTSLSAGTSIEALASQVREFKPLAVSVADETSLKKLKLLLGADCPQIFFGPEGHRHCIEMTQPDVVMSAMMGTHGLEATLQAILQNTPVVGIANKEILVMAGPFIMAAVEESKSTLVPVDSEHSAIFQALMGNKMSAVKSLILTASGGPFRTRDPETFASITKEEALKHPNWSMGAKITIDSATLMNKGLEYIEALRLFRVSREQMKVVVHPESVIHSLVEYCDGSVMAQLGLSDMKIPISLALGYPDRLPLDFEKPFDLIKIGKLHFEEPDVKKFRCLWLAMNCDRYGVHGSVVMNAANEKAVALFLQDQIRFVEIPEIVEAALEQFQSYDAMDLNEVMSLDREAQEWVIAGRWRERPSAGRRETSIVR